MPGSLISFQLLRLLRKVAIVDPVTIHSQEEHFRAHESDKRYLLGFSSAEIAEKGGLNNPLPSTSLTRPFITFLELLDCIGRAGHMHPLTVKTNSHLLH